MAEQEISGPVVLDENGEITPEQVAEMLGAAGGPPGGAPPSRGPSDLEVAVAGALEEVVIPANIEVEDKGVFVAKGLRSWAWTPFGVYAVGHYEGENPEEDKHVLIAGRKIVTIELDAATYEEAVAAQKAESEAEETKDAEESETPSD